MFKEILFYYLYKFLKYNSTVIIICNSEYLTISHILSYFNKLMWQFLTNLLLQARLNNALTGKKSSLLNFNTLNLFYQ